VRSLILLALLIFPSWIGYRQFQAHWRKPEALLVLGGTTDRENFAAELAQRYPHLPIWVSGGSNPEYTLWVFSEAGVDLDRVHIDRTAVDTVTNFTTLVDKLADQDIHCIYLITSDYHMQRAYVIGEIVFGSRGISLKPIEVPSSQPVESIAKTIRDGGRAIVWLITGHTGSTLLRRSQAP
jgi:uncharacterized SAM-binding protein YcdF (DUF218 family)